MTEWKLAEEEMEDYVIEGGLLHTLRPPPDREEYPRLELPPSARYREIRGAHVEMPMELLGKHLIVYRNTTSGLVSGEMLRNLYKSVQYVKYNHGGKSDLIL